MWGNATCDGYIVSYGDALYRSLDAVHRLQHMGLSVGLVNKCHVNVVDEETWTSMQREREGGREREREREYAIKSCPGRAYDLIRLLL